MPDVTPKQQTRRRIAAAFILLGMAAGPAAAVVGLREAAGSLERQLHAHGGGVAKQSFQLPLIGSPLVLLGSAELERVGADQCRRTVELVHDKPFERRGVRITNLSRRSVQDGPCRDFADAMAIQANLTAQSIAEQVGVASAGADSTPGARQLVAQAGSSPSTPAPAVAPKVAEPIVMLTVREKAIIRDAPDRGGEKLSRVDAGTHLSAQRVPNNPDWFVLDGGLRFISASVVEVVAPAAAALSTLVQGDSDGVRLQIMEPAVLRNAPSFKSQKVASLAAGVERLARKVPNIKGWFELIDSESRYPLYIHESVVNEKKSDKRL